MKILCAPDSFKESLSAIEIAKAMAAGVLRAAPNATADLCPVGDGGEGTLDVLLNALNGEIVQCEVIGPLGRPMPARFGIISHQSTAVVELAEASGLVLVPHDARNPMHTTTYGTGQLIRRAVEAGCRRIIVCVGGSATVDGGIGIAQALGARFWRQDGSTFDEPMTGAHLSQIAKFEPPPNLPEIEVACDVTNPLCGANGAATVYGPQKGATPHQVLALDEGLAHLARIVGGDPDAPGSGAAGGAAFGLAAMCKAQLRRGIDLILQTINFHSRCADASLVLTGEGRLDRQSLQGKACMGVARAAAETTPHAPPVIAIVGSTGEGAEECVKRGRDGFLDGYVSLIGHFGEDRAWNHTADSVSLAAAEIVMKYLHP